jgi:hypothetical protein
MADPSPLPISNEDFEHFMRDLDTSLLVPDPEPEWQGPASDEPPIDVSLYSLLDQRSVTSFSSVHTRQSVASIPSISVPEEFSAQFASLTLASEAVVQEAIRAVDALPQVHTASKASFLRRYPMWIDHLEYVIVIALTLAFYDDQCILLFAEEFQFCNFMARHTIRSVFIIIEADRRKGGTLKDHSAGKAKFFGELTKCLLLSRVPLLHVMHRPVDGRRPHRALHDLTVSRPHLGAVSGHDHLGSS